jgi:nucleoside-diphosphate-sugar epimerase
MTIRALITGATGFIGRCLAPRLAAEGFLVTSLQRSPEDVRGVDETITLPLLTPDSVAGALRSRSFDCLFHLASYGVNPGHRDLSEMFRINVDVTRTLVEIAASWPGASVVMSGSGAEYDLSNATSPVSEFQPLESFKSYGASKAAGGLLALAAARASNLPLAYLRLFGVFGPGEAAHRLLPSLVEQLRQKKRVPLSAGDQLRDFLYVEDVVSALIAAVRFLGQSPRQTTMNLSSGEPTSVRHFAECVADLMGAPRSLLGFGDIAKRPDDVMLFSGRPDLIEKTLGWQRKYSVETGLRAALRDMGSLT